MSNQKKFTLINPAIVGKFEKTVYAKTSDDAVTELWKNVSKYINGNVPSFAVSIKQDGGKLYHYEIKESVKNGKVETNLKKLRNLKVSSEDINKFSKKTESLKLSVQNGGKHKNKDDDSSSSSDSEYEYYFYENYGRYPINHILYNTNWYLPRVQTLFMPTWRYVSYVQLYT